MKDYILQPAQVVNVKALPASIAVPADGPAVLGAAARIADVAAHEALRRAFPALADAAALVGTPQIRNAGTVGGNLCQRPRCWYFRNEDFRCLKKGGPGASPSKARTSSTPSTATGPATSCTRRVSRCH